ncbi:hypothetical protein V6V47_11645 [Micromonospora sp. CPCC 205539]|uniref:hypothetical protein n=1 Tax=Micromonospora sp. CPCC 205539 TaxID=3122408 RepID=UPI002FF1AEE3
MTVVWVVLGFVAVVGGGLFGVVARRDRGRVTSVEDGVAGRDARTRQQRYEAQRHGEQGDTWQRGRDSTG